MAEVVLRTRIKVKVTCVSASIYGKTFITDYVYFIVIHVHTYVFENNRFLIRNIRNKNIRTYYKLNLLHSNFTHMRIYKKI